LTPKVDESINLENIDAVYTIGKFEHNANPTARLKLPNGELRDLVIKAHGLNKPIYLFDQFKNLWFKFDTERGEFWPYREGTDLATPSLSENPLLYSEKNIYDKGILAMIDLFQKEVNKRRSDALSESDSFNKDEVKKIVKKSDALAKVKAKKKKNNEIDPDCK
jgi:hypothetical protein